MEESNYVITTKAGARKFAMHTAGKLLREHMALIPVEKVVHPACVPLVMQEMEQIAEGLTKRARNIQADDLTENPDV